jgi:hypothetical protein
MEHDLGAIIKAINEVGENIWLGDYERAKEVADFSLVGIEKNVEIYKLQVFADSIRKTIRESRKDAKEKKIEDIDAWITEQILERMKREERKPIENIMGVSIIRLSSLRDMLGFLIESRSQKTLGNFEEKETAQEETVRKGEKYRFSIRGFPGRWEVRAVLADSVRQWNFEELRDRLSGFTLSIAESKSELSKAFEVFSQSMYAEIFVQDRQIEFLIKAHAVEDVRQRIEKLVETVIKFLIT